MARKPAASAIEERVAEPAHNSKNPALLPIDCSTFGTLFSGVNGRLFTFAIRIIGETRKVSGSRFTFGEMESEGRETDEHEGANTS